MKKSIFNFKMLKQVFSIIFVPFVPNILGDRKLSKINLLPLRVLVAVNCHFMMKVCFIKALPDRLQEKKKWKKKYSFAQHCTLNNDSSATLKAFFSQSQIPYKSILHCPWRSSLVEHLDFVLVFKKKTTSGRAVLSWLALLSTICTSREGFFLSCFLFFLFVLQSKFWSFSLFSTAPSAWGVSLNTTFDWINILFFFPLVCSLLLLLTHPQLLLVVDVYLLKAQKTAFLHLD